MTGRYKKWVRGRSLAGTAGSNPAGGMDVLLLWVLSGRGFYVGLITRPEESYRVWCVWVWSWIVDKEEALAHWGGFPPQKKKYIYNRYKYSNVYVRGFNMFGILQRKRVPN